MNDDKLVKHYFETNYLVPKESCENTTHWIKRTNKCLDRNQLMKRGEMGEEEGMKTC